MEELENKIEAILFASGKGVTETQLTEYCESKPAKVKKALEKLSKIYQERDCSLIVVKHNEKWKLTVRGKYTTHIQKIVSETELPRTILKTLALVAFKSPVLQADIINMRGQSAYDHIKELVKEKLVTKEESGRSYMLKITDKFYNYFDVEGDEEIRDLFENLRKKQQQITELEIINIAEEQESKDKQGTTLGELKVVDSNIEGDHEEIFEEKIIPRRNEKTEEEKQEEQSFLSDIDSRIGELSKRIENHELPKQTEELTTNEEGHEQSAQEQETEQTKTNSQTTNTNDDEEEENFL